MSSSASWNNSAHNISDGSRNMSSSASWNMSAHNISDVSQNISTSDSEDVSSSSSDYLGAIETYVGSAALVVLSYWVLVDQALASLQRLRRFYTTLLETWN